MLFQWPFLVLWALKAFLVLKKKLRNYLFQICELLFIFAMFVFSELISGSERSFLMKPRNVRTVRISGPIIDDI